MNELMRRYMNKYICILLTLLAGTLCLSSCSDDDTYADQKKRERKVIESFLKRDMAILDEEGDTICHVGKINPITEAQFYAQDSTTNLEKNEYVLFSGTGLYMQIVREGVGEKLKSGDRKRILCRFIEYNILGDSLQLRDDVPFWHTNPEILDVSNNAGSFNASFNTPINGGGAMYLTYKDVNVPTGWVKPLSFIRLGRQVNYDEGIAKVRLIVPHSEGTSNATSNVYPCFYEITYQEMRD